MISDLGMLGIIYDNMPTYEAPAQSPPQANAQCKGLRCREGGDIHIYIIPSPGLRYTPCEGSFCFLITRRSVNKFWLHFSFHPFAGFLVVETPRMGISETKSTPFTVPELGSSGNGRPPRSWSLGNKASWGLGIQEIQSSADSPPLAFERRERS